MKKIYINLAGFYGKVYGIMQNTIYVAQSKGRYIIKHEYTAFVILYNLETKMSKINLIILEGNVTIDPVEITTGNKKFTKFNFVHNQYNSQKKEEKASFYQVLVFGNLAKHAVRLKKGMPIIIQGTISIESNRKGNVTHNNPTILAQKISGIPIENQNENTEGQEHYIGDIDERPHYEEQPLIDFNGYDYDGTPDM